MRAAPAPSPESSPAASRGLGAARRSAGDTRAHAWLALLGVLAILALLLGFHRVVRGAVEQGELLKQSVASRADAVWRCQSLQRASVRASCLAQIDAPPVREDIAPPPNTAALAAAAGAGS